MNQLDVVKNWIDSHISVMQSDEVTDEISSSYLCELMLVIATHGVIARPDKASFSDILSDIRRMDQLWVEAGKYMVFKYHVPLTRYGCLILLKVLVFPDAEDDSVFQTALNEYVEELDSGIEHKFDPNNNPGALKEYFTIMRELETFYQDPERYDSDEKRKKSERLLELYQALMFKRTEE